MLDEERRRVKEPSVFDDLPVFHAPAQRQLQRNVPRQDPCHEIWRVLDFHIEQSPGDVARRHDLLLDKSLKTVGTEKPRQRLLDAGSATIFSTQAKRPARTQRGSPKHVVVECVGERLQIASSKCVNHVPHQFFSVHSPRAYCEAHPLGSRVLVVAGTFVLHGCLPHRSCAQFRALIPWMRAAVRYASSTRRGSSAAITSMKSIRCWFTSSVLFWHQLTVRHGSQLFTNVKFSIQCFSSPLSTRSARIPKTRRHL